MRRRNTVDEDTRSISVRDYSGAGLAIAGAQEMMPFAGREFVRTDRVFVRFALYGRAAVEAIVSAQLTSRQGASLMVLPVTGLTDRARPGIRSTCP